MAFQRYHMLRPTVPGFQAMPVYGPTGERRTYDFQALPGEINYDPLDRFTFAHAGSGAVLGLLRVPWWVALLASISWDLLERPLKYYYPQLFPHYTQDTAQHVVIDGAAWMLGWAVTKQLMDLRARRVGA